MKNNILPAERRYFPMLLLVTLVLGAAAWFLWRDAPESSGSADSTATPPQAAEPGHPHGAASPAPNAPQTSAELNGIELRPLPVARSSDAHEWTDGDGFDLEVIARISLNPDHFHGMLEENDRIHRRQLVYRNETSALMVQRARQSGEPLQRLTLPALDGRELDFIIDHSDLQPSGQSGTFTGRLAGRPESLVTLAFQFGREAFTVLSPEDDLYLQADPRKPGEVIVKSIDPAVYAHAPCGNPDHNHDH